MKAPRTIRPLLASILLALLAAPAPAAEVSAADAARAASAWVDRGYAMGRLPAGRAVAGVDEVEDPATGARLRVVRFEGGGYVVLSADDLVDPVLAFSETGEGLVLDDANPFWALLRGDIAAREAAAGVSRVARGAAGKGSARRAEPAGPTASKKRWADLLSSGGNDVLRSMQGVSSVSDVRVSPLVKSKWSQSTSDNYYGSTKYCYNYYTPNHYVCGCTATAIAQIMRYWQYPTASVTAHSYPCSAGGTSGTYAMKGGTYAWSNMPLDPRNASGLTEAQRQAIGKLCYDVGVTLEVDWNSGGSSASLYAGVACLPIDFGYASAKAVNYGFGKNYDLEHFKRGVIPNLDARCPVGVSVTGAGGHSVVGDGYGYSGGDFYIHLNMGWAGSDDAWYCPPNLGTSSYAFNAISGFLFNVFPKKTGSIASGRVLDASGAPVSGATVALMRNGAAVATATSDAKGVYAFIAPAGTYVLDATKGSTGATASVTLAETTGTTIVTDTGSRGHFYSGAGTIGNTYGNDLVLTRRETVPAPVFSPGGCLFYPSTNVTISCADPAATIRYTLDGSDPTEASPAYALPILVDADVTIRARAFATGKTPSPVVAETYAYDKVAAAPPGDYFARPIAISGTSGAHVIDDDADYTIEDGEPQHTLSGGISYSQYRSVWYLWKAPGTGTATFRTSSTGGGYLLPTYVAVYTGDRISAITRLAFATARDANYATSVSVDVVQGTVYRIAGVAGNSRAGSFTLQWSGDLTAGAPIPVHRFYSKNYKGHFFTVDGAEKNTLVATNPNWNYEGVAYRAFPEKVQGTTPLYRFYSKGYRGHFFTIDEEEMRTVRDTNPNWKYEGVAYYVYPERVEGSLPVYRFWSKKYRHHFYTIDEAEMRTVRDTNPNWKYERVAFFALPCAEASAAAEECAAPDGPCAAPDAEWALVAGRGEGAVEVAPAGVTDIGGVLVEARADPPDASEMAAGREPAAMEPGLRRFRLLLPSGLWSASLWSAAEGPLADANVEGAFDFDLAPSGVWHWLRVRDGKGDGDAADAFSLWLRAE